MINYIDTRKFVEKKLTTYFLWSKKKRVSFHNLFLCGS